MKFLKSFLSIFSILLFIFMVYFAFKDIEKIKEILKFSNKFYLLLSAIFFLAFNLFSIYIVKFIYHFFSLELSFKRAFYISFISILGRYLPGRFWTFTLLLAFSKTLNLDLKKITKGAILNQFFLIFSAIPTLCFYFLEVKNYLLSFTFLISFIVLPIVLHFLSLKYEIKLNLLVFFKIFFMFIILWILVGLSLFFFILSFSKSINLFYTILIFPIAYNIGILSNITSRDWRKRRSYDIYAIEIF